MPADFGHCSVVQAIILPGCINVLPRGLPRPPMLVLFTPKGPTPKAEGASGSRDGEKLPS